SQRLRLPPPKGRGNRRSPTGHRLSPQGLHTQRPVSARPVGTIQERALHGLRRAQRISRRFFPSSFLDLHSPPPRKFSAILGARLGSLRTWEELRNCRRWSGILIESLWPRRK